MFALLLQRHGIDFTKYLPGSLFRRITLRMERVGIEDYGAYADYLASASDESDRLLNTILINHTAFFRDPETWAAIATEYVPSIIASKPAGAPLRIWSAGCATGQEPYSLAMLLAELLGLEDLAARVSIYATDVDVDALRHVREARYHAWHTRMVPPRLLDRYFVPDGRHYVVGEELRRVVTAQRHNLLADAPLPRIDLLICRNVLIYLNLAAQERVIGALCDALADDGVLVLGKTELAFPKEHNVRWVSTQHRIGSKDPLACESPNRTTLAGA
jgi:two-component system CheB/CheR fusion protein